MLIKTTKGIYDFDNNYLRAFTNGKIDEKWFNITFGFDYGRYVNHSDNLNDLLDLVCKYENDKEFMTFSSNILALISRFRTDKEFVIQFNYKLIGMIWCDDDLVKVADWDNEKGDWKLYER